MRRVDPRVRQSNLNQKRKGMVGMPAVQSNSRFRPCRDRRANRYLRGRVRAGHGVRLAADAAQGKSKIAFISRGPQRSTGLYVVRRTGAGGGS